MKYAHVVDNVVFEIIQPANDSEGKEIPIGDLYHPDFVAELVDISAADPQPQAKWTYTDGKFSPPAPPAEPTLAELANAALSAGLAITSTGTPALAGVYSVNADSQNKIQAIALFIVVNSKFPGGQATYPWLDLNGEVHVFPGTAEFSTFATAVADYVAVLDHVIAGAVNTLPAATAVIA